jgi:hypothetical protein
VSAVSERSGGSHVPNPLDRVLDTLTDLAVWAFAIWTVIYYLGRALGWPTTPLLVATVLLTLVAVRPAWRHSHGPQTGVNGLGAVVGRQPTLLALAGVVLTAGACLVHLGTSPMRYAAGWALSVAALVPLAWVALTRERGTRRDAAEEGAVPESVSDAAAGARRRWTLPGLVASLGVTGAAAALAVLSLLTVRKDADDVFYVNKAVWVAEHGTIPTRDTIYSDQVLPALRGAGTAPVQSIEVLQGALAHVFGLAGGSVVYLLTPLVVSFLAVWTLWRLVREWSRERAVVAAAVAVVYLLWAVKDGYGLGAFFIGRDWQGKVVFACLGIPLLYLALSTWARRRSGYDGLRLFAIGAACVGLTSTATLVVPPIGLTVAVAMLLCGYRHWWGALLTLVYPVVTGAVVAASNTGGEFGAVDFTSAQAFHHVVGKGLFMAVGLAAILLAPWLVRRGPTRVVVTAGSLAALVVMAPGMPDVLNRLTGAGPILYRMAWVPAIPALVGVLATAPWRLERAPAPARIAVVVLVPAVVVVAILLGGKLLWTRGDTSIYSGPEWKYDQQPLEDARWIERTYDGSTPVLAPWPVMRGLALSTTEVHGVDPRSFYLQSLDEPAAQHQARIDLSQSMRNGNPKPQADFLEDLDRLDVEYVCLDDAKKRIREVLAGDGWTAERHNSRLTCYAPGG